VSLTRSVAEPAAAQPSPKEEVYSNPVARKILQRLLRDTATVIKPEIRADDEIVYPQLEAFLDGDVPEDAESLLSRMAEVGILVGELADKAPRCPECGSQQLSTRYVCVRCYAFDITRTYLYEHLKCGKVASDESFRRGDQLICPKCQVVLHDFGVQFRAVGAWYKCNNCSESFDRPTHMHFCRANRHQFTAERATLASIYQYKLNPNSLAEIRRSVLLYADAITILENLGLEVSAPRSLRGKSGNEHPFDIVVTMKGRFGGSKVVAMDVIVSNEYTGTDTVRSFAAKVKEARPSESHLLVIPGLTDEARKAAKQLKVNVKEGSTVRQAVEGLLGEASFK
jgi:hypothetical protein